MSYSPTLLPEIIQAIATTIEDNADTVTQLDQAIGDGDHVINLQRGIDALIQQGNELSELNWPEAFQKIGMTLLTTMGGASGSLFGTLFISMGKAAKDKALDRSGFAEVFNQGVIAVKQRGKADAGEKTMLDVLIPVAQRLIELAPTSTTMNEKMDAINGVAEAGVESTRDMLATKGRASFLGERSRGHLDAGAKTSQLMIAATISVLLTTPA
jgi:dihydroxyacetone kinase-like protein